VGFIYKKLNQEVSFIRYFVCCNLAYFLSYVKFAFRNLLLDEIEENRLQIIFNRLYPMIRKVSPPGPEKLDRITRPVASGTNRNQPQCFQLRIF